MVTALAGSGVVLPHSLTELYTVMVLGMVRRTAELSHIAVSTMDGVPAGVKTSLLNIGKLALSGLKKGRLVFHVEKDVRPTCGDIAQLFGLLEELWTVSLCGGSHEAQFCHLTYQEFLAAYYVSQSNFAELESCQREIGFSEEMSSFWRFVGGLSGQENVKMFMSFLNRAHGGAEALGARKWQLLKMTCFAEAVSQPCPAGEDAAEHAQIATQRHKQAAAELLLPETLDLSSEAVSISDMYAVAISLSLAEHVTNVLLHYCDLDCQHADLLHMHGSLRHTRNLGVTGNPRLHGKGLSIVAAALAQNGALLHLNLSECRLDDDDCGSLCDILKANPSLRELILSRNTVSVSTLQLFQPILSCSELELISLVSTSLNAECGRVLGAILASRSHLRDVDLSDNPLGNRGAEAVVRGAATPKPGLQRSKRRLILTNTGLNDNVIDLLSVALQERLPTNPSVRHDAGPTCVPLMIWLSGNDISQTALQQLAVHLPQKHVVYCGMFDVWHGALRRQDLAKCFRKRTKASRTVALQGMQIDSDGAAQITRQLRRFPVQVLDLSSNLLGNDGVRVLGQALESNPGLCCLLLAFNRISRSPDLFSVLIQTNNSLAWLELCGNPIFDELKSQYVAESRECLSRLVAGAQGLKYIGLGMTGLGDEECRVLQAALSANSGGLIFISLGRNRITSQGAAALADGVSKNTTVRFLNLASNAIGNDGALAIAQCVQARGRTGSPLQRVFMCGNRCDADCFVAAMVDTAFFYTNALTAMESFDF